MEILCFINENKVDEYFEFLKKNISINEKENKFMTYYEKTWLKKYKKMFNYGNLIYYIHKSKNLFIIKKGDKYSKNNLVSKFKSLEKVYFTNNVCESIHGQIAKYIQNRNVSKSLFKDTIIYILNKRFLNFSKIVRRDFVTRSLIILIEKQNLNENPLFINFKELKQKIENTIAIMTGKIDINSIDELLNSMENLDISEKNIESEDEDLDYCSDYYDNDNNTSSVAEEEIEEYIDSNCKYLENFLFFDSYIDNIYDKNNVLNNEIINNFNEKKNGDLYAESSENNLNISKILKERNYLNIFTLNIKDNMDDLKYILLKEDDSNNRSDHEEIDNEDLESLEDKY